MFDFSNVSAVVMDDSIALPTPNAEWSGNFRPGLLPEHVRTLLLSATVGNAVEFLHWLRHSHNRKLELVGGDQRRVPLRHHWVGDRLLTEHLEDMAQGDDEARTTPALVFCFNREECWTAAEQLKGNAS